MDSVCRLLKPEFLPQCHVPPPLCPRTLCRFRERNRVAQRRYRNRQREKLAEKEVKLAELNERLMVLTTEKVVDCCLSPRLCCC